MKLKTLAITTTILFATSILVFLNENKRNVYLSEGSDYIKGLDVEKIQKIAVRFKEKHFHGKQSIVLVREGDRFLIENHQSYPASPSRVNELLYNIANIQIKRKITDDVSAKNLEQFELGEDQCKYAIDIYDNSGNKSVSFRVGKGHGQGGVYLYREGGKAVYLSKRGMYIDNAYINMTDTTLINTNPNEIAEIIVRGKRHVHIAHKDEAFKVISPKGKKYKAEDIKNYIDTLSRLGFENFIPASDAKVRSLKFNTSVQVKLKNTVIYKLALAKHKEDHYIKMSATIEEVRKNITISKDDSPEKLKSIENTMKAQGIANRTNRDKLGWVYRIREDVYQHILRAALAP